VAPSSAVEFAVVKQTRLALPLAPLAVVLAALLAPAHAGASLALAGAGAPERVSALSRVTRARTDAREGIGVSLEIQESEFDFEGAASLSLVDSERSGCFEIASSVQLAPLEISSAFVASRPKTRIGVFRILGSPLVGAWSLESADLHWAFVEAGAGIVSGKVDARWYDPHNGVWLSEDPLGAVDSENLYAFGGMNPASATDPFGLFRVTRNGGVNSLGNWGDSATSIFGGIVMDTVGNTVSDLLGLDTIADSAFVAGDSSQSSGYRLWAAAKGIGTATLDVAGGAIAGRAAKVAARVPGLSKLVNAVAASRVGQAVASIAGREVRALGFVDDLVRAAGDSTVGRVLNTDVSELGNATVRNSRFANTGDLTAETFTRYQRYTDEAFSSVSRAQEAGRLTPPPGIATETYMGQQIDNIARIRMRRWLSSEGIDEGANEMLRVNRWLRDPAGSGKYRIPDVRVVGANIFDGTIGMKSLLTPQIADYFRFSMGEPVTIVRPTALGGSFSILR